MQRPERMARRRDFVPPATIKPCRLAAIFVREDFDDAWKLPCCIQVHRRDPSSGDRTTNDVAIEQIVSRILRRVVRLAGHLQFTVDPVGRTSDMRDFTN